MLKYFALLLPIFLPLAHGKETLRIAVVSDLNGSGCQEKVPSSSIAAFEQMLSEQDVGHMIQTGDAIGGQCSRYNGPGTYESMVSKMWAEYDKNFYGAAFTRKGISLILAPGNHDAPYIFSGSPKTFQIEHDGFIRYWNGLKSHLTVEPVAIEGSKYPYYWAYLKDQIFYVVLESTRTHTLSNAALQKAWLRKALSSNEARGARLRIAYGHVPPYAILDPSVGSKHKEILGEEQVGKRDSLVDLLLDFKVDLLAVGHSHAPYPADLVRKRDQAKMKILSMPCGASPRKLFGKTNVSPHGYAIVEVSPENKIEIRIMDAKAKQPLKAEYFPVEIPQGKEVTYKRAMD